MPRPRLVSQLVLTSGYTFSGGDMFVISSLQWPVRNVLYHDQYKPYIPVFSQWDLDPIMLSVCGTTTMA